jgi:N-glycosylase/DNA lyase
MCTCRTILILKLYCTDNTVLRSLALHGRVLSLKQDRECLYYRAIWPTVDSKPKAASAVTKNEADDDTEALIRHYFNLGPNLTELCEKWSAADPNFKKKAPKFTGVRIMKQVWLYTAQPSILLSN